jgi:hypothetical protein
VDHQVQLRAAFALKANGEISPDEYQIIRLMLDENRNCAPKLSTGDTEATFSPWAPEVQSRPLPPGWGPDEHGVLKCINPELARKAGLTGVVPVAETNKATKADGVSADPVRTKTGRFRSNVAEVWYYKPDTGLVARRAFTTKGAIATAFAFAREIQSHWTAEKVKDVVAVVKFRSGNMAGNRHVHIVSSMGYIATPQDVVRWGAQAAGAGIKQRVGERQSQTKLSSILAMLEQNKQIKAVLGFDSEVGKVMIRQNLDWPSCEPEDPNEIAYSVRFQSGDRRVISILPLGDTKDDNGNVVLSGHRRRAYRLLLETTSSRCDAPQTIRYVVYGKDDELPKIHVIGRDEAITWAEVETSRFERAIEKLDAAYQNGDIELDEYTQRRAVEESRLELDATYTPPRRPAMHQPATLVEYVEGRQYWGKASNSNSIGSNWVGGMSYLEAQIYNMG